MANFFRRRPARRADGTDFADFGTAFGLDLSLTVPAAPAVAAPAKPRRGWVQRLTARPKTAA